MAHLPAIRRTVRTHTGSVLVIVLWVAVGLLAITLTFGRSMMMNYRSSDNALAGCEAEQAIEGGLRYVEIVLSNLTTKGEVPDVTSYESEDVPVGEARFWILGRGSDDQQNSQPVYGIVDEASKLSLNSATSAMLQGLPGMTPELADSIEDWRDEDPDPKPNGAESETYLLQQPAYSCKNDKFETLDELLLVHGADEVTVFGEDANENGLLDQNEDDADRTPPTDNGNGKLEPGIIDYVTPFTQEPNMQADGSERVTANNKQAPDLSTYLTGKLPSRAPAILQAIPDGVQIRSLLEFAIRGNMTAEEVATVQGDLKFRDNDNIGLVNVNTASETVLAALFSAIPTIGSEKAATVVAARAKKTGATTDILWLKDDAVLGRQGAIDIGPYITGRSFQFSVDIAAVGRHGRGYRRTRFVVDLSTGTPRVVHRQNLAPLGWALGTDVRQMLAERKDTY